LFTQHDVNFFAHPEATLYNAIKFNHNEIVAWLMRHIDGKFWSQERAKQHGYSSNLSEESLQASEMETIVMRHPSLIRIIAHNPVHQRMFDLLLNSFPTEMSALIEDGMTTCNWY
jgi:hypothetical protein